MMLEQAVVGIEMTEPAAGGSATLVCCSKHASISEESQWTPLVF